MFRNFFRKAVPAQTIRKFSTDSTDHVRSDINSFRKDLRPDINSLKGDVSTVKKGLSELRAEMHKEFDDAHKQSNMNVMTILAGMFGVSATTIIATQILNSKHDKADRHELPRNR